ncbi:MAG: translation elongation factor-like protein [Chloroflexota bacterium]|nr:translation elongation factor-like protein [Chloroflexota bacterium]
MAEKMVGKVTHYYTRIGVAAVELSDQLKLGDTIRILGHTSDFEQVVRSMQLKHEDIAIGQAGQSIGLEVAERVRRGDKVFKLT